MLHHLIVISILLRSSISSSFGSPGYHPYAQAEDTLRRMRQGGGSTWAGKQPYPQPGPRDPLRRTQQQPLPPTMYTGDIPGVGAASGLPLGSQSGWGTLGTTAPGDPRVVFGSQSPQRAGSSPPAYPAGLGASSPQTGSPGYDPYAQAKAEEIKARMRQGGTWAGGESYQQPGSSDPFSRHTQQSTLNPYGRQPGSLAQLAPTRRPRRGYQRGASQLGYTPTAGLAASQAMGVARPSPYAEMRRLRESRLRPGGQQALQPPLTSAGRLTHELTHDLIKRVFTTVSQDLQSAIALLAPHSSRLPPPLHTALETLTRAERQCASLLISYRSN